MMMGDGGAGGAQLPASLSVTDFELSPTDSQCTITFDAAGTYSSIGNGSSPSGTWKLWGNGSDYDIRFDVSSGTLSAGTANTWENLGTSRAYVKTNTGTGTLSVNGTLRIRNALTLVEIDSCSLLLSATSDV